MRYSSSKLTSPDQNKKREFGTDQRAVQQIPPSKRGTCVIKPKQSRNIQI